MNNDFTVITVFQKYTPSQVMSPTQTSPRVGRNTFYTHTVVDTRMYDLYEYIVVRLRRVFLMNIDYNLKKYLRRSTIGTNLNEE